MSSYSQRHDSKSTIPRENSQRFITVYFLVYYFLYFVCRTERPPVWQFVLIGMAYLPVILVLVYQARTPLLKIEQGVLTSYGTMPWGKRTFLLADITRITFTKSLNFWTSARSLSIETASDRCKLWIRDRHSSNNSEQVQKIRKLFTASFKSKYVEVNL